MARAERHPGYQSEYSKRYRIEQAEKVRLSKHKSSLKRRARLREAWVEEVDPSVVFGRDEGTCQICGQVVDPDDWHVDHIQPLCRGGAHSYANVQVACPPCNLSKGGRWDQAA